jgi:hypothetical protein
MARLSGFAIIVFAGLNPAIHPFAKEMDARVKPGHDDSYEPIKVSRH